MTIIHAPALSAFAGRWQFRRSVTAADGSAMAEVEGLLEFTPDAAGLVAEERGEMRLASGQVLAASRRTLWRQAGGRIEVRFGDGRPFHSFDPAEAASAEHPCGADLYRVAYDFGSWPLWRSSWRVTGPRKDYLLTTDHRPALA